MNTTKAEAKTQTVTIVNMNGEMHIHAAGCKDLTRLAKYRNETSRWDDEVADFRDVVNSVYGPDAGGFYEEAGLTEADWEDYSGEFVVYPCVKHLPHDLGSRYEIENDTTTIENTDTEENDMNTTTIAAKALHIENIDKGVWDVTDETGAVVATFTGRAAARKFVAEQKALATMPDSDVAAAEDAQKVLKGEKPTLKEISDKVIAKKAAGEYDKPKASKKAKAEKPAKVTAPKAESVPVVDGWALLKHAKHLDALRDAKGNLPAGIVDAFLPRGAAAVVGLYFTTAAEFDTSKIATAYVLRCSETGRMVEVQTKREGREKVAGEFGATVEA